MTNKSEWQDANRRLASEQREKLGDPPTAEEMLAYSRGELSGEEEDRIRDLLVAYPELARIYNAPFPEEPEADVSNEVISDGWNDVRRRLGVTVDAGPRTGAELHSHDDRGRTGARVLRPLSYKRKTAHVTTPAATSPVFSAHRRSSTLTAAAGSDAPKMLRKDGDAYLLKPHLLNQVHYAHYSIELHDTSGAVWTSPSAQPDDKGTFQIVIPHDFLRPGVRYQLRIFGIDGDAPRPVGSYDVMVPSE